VLRHVLEVVVQSHVYAGLLLFLGGYVVVSSLYWIAASLVFWRHREAAAADFYELDEEPPVSVLVAAHNEEAVIADTIRHLRAVDWPEVEIVVVDDGSTDATPEILGELARAGPTGTVTWTQQRFGGARGGGRPTRAASAATIATAGFTA